MSYSNAVKEGQLGVRHEVLVAHGAVSAQTGRAMAEGAPARLGVDVAASITGVAGPSGGSEAKPVGLTYVAVADDRGVEVRRIVWPSIERGTSAPVPRPRSDAPRAVRGSGPTRSDDAGRGTTSARVSRPHARRARDPGGRAIHVVGVGGAGASAAAILARAAGAAVSGCDSGGPSPYTPAVEAAGIPIAWAMTPRT